MKETPAQVFSSEICKIYKNTFSKEPLRANEKYEPERTC